MVHRSWWRPQLPHSARYLTTSIQLNRRLPKTISRIESAHPVGGPPSDLLVFLGSQSVHACRFVEESKQHNDAPTSPCTVADLLDNASSLCLRFATEFIISWSNWSSKDILPMLDGMAFLSGLVWRCSTLMAVQVRRKSLLWGQHLLFCRSEVPYIHMYVVGKTAVAARS